MSRLRSPPIMAPDFNRLAQLRLMVKLLKIIISLFKRISCNIIPT